MLTSSRTVLATVPSQITLEAISCPVFLVPISNHLHLLKRLRISFNVFSFQCKQCRSPQKMSVSQELTFPGPVIRGENCPLQATGRSTHRQQGWPRSGLTATQPPAMPCGGPRLGNPASEAGLSAYLLFSWRPWSYPVPERHGCGEVLLR